MPRIQRGQQQPSRLQQGGPLPESGNSGFGQGNAPSVPFGKKAKIKDHGSQGFAYHFGEPFVPHGSQLHLTEAPMLMKEAGSGLKRFRLDIECPYPPFSPNQPCQKQGVITIAAGCIHGSVTRPQPLAKQIVCKGNSTAQVAGQSICHVLILFTFHFLPFTHLKTMYHSHPGKSTMQYAAVDCAILLIYGCIFSQ